MRFKSLEFQIGIRVHKNRYFFKDTSLIKDFCFIKNPRNYWLADPFVINIGDKHYIFAEAARKTNWRGKLVYSEINEENLKKCKWKTCLLEDYHLSFPNVFTDTEGLHVIPESSESKALYRYNLISQQNKKITFGKKEILKNNVQFVDSIFYKEYLITYNIESLPYKLQMFAKDGNHLIDEIVDSRQHLRPAGNIITDITDIFVSQDCEAEYGQGIIFNRIMIKNGRLNIKPLLEVDASLLNKELKQKIFTGIHTYNFDDKYEVIDVKKNTLSLPGFVGKIIRRIKSRK